MCFVNGFENMYVTERGLCGGFDYPLAVAKDNQVKNKDKALLDHRPLTVYNGSPIRANFFVLVIFSTKSYYVHAIMNRIHKMK